MELREEDGPGVSTHPFDPILSEPDETTWALAMPESPFWRSSVSAFRADVNPRSAHPQVCSMDAENALDYCNGISFARSPFAAATG